MVVLMLKKGQIFEQKLFRLLIKNLLLLFKEKKFWIDTQNKSRFELKKEQIVLFILNKNQRDLNSIKSTPSSIITLLWHINFLNSLYNIIIL
jgi:hypothetical protein